MVVDDDGDHGSKGQGSSLPWWLAIVIAVPLIIITVAIIKIVMIVNEKKRRRLEEEEASFNRLTPGLKGDNEMNKPLKQPAHSLNDDEGDGDDDCQPPR